MLASLIVVFREVLEAGLIVGIVLAATAGVPQRGLWVSGGLIAGVLGASLLAAFAGALSSALEGVGQEVFTAAILMVAVVMLSWHVVWMGRHGRELATQARSLGRSVRVGERSLLALAAVVAIAVLREGSEVVLFLYGIAASAHEGPMAMLAGGGLGVALAAFVSYLLYRGLLVIPARHLFTATNALITLLAAGMAGQAAATLASADLVSSWGDHLWNTSRFLSENSIVGRALHALVGYSDRPSGVQVAAYGTTLVLLTALSWLTGTGHERKPAGQETASRASAR
jgi:high-affinity iron transporter